MYVYDENIYVEKMKDLEWLEECEDISHLGYRTDNESINESEMNTILVVQLA